MSIFLLMVPTTYAVTLREALTLAYSNNPAHKAMRESVKASAETAAGALRSGFLPEVSGQIVVGRNAVRRDFDGKDSLLHMEPDSGTVKSRRRTISLSQNLFNFGGSVAQAKAQKAQLDKAVAEFYAAEQDFMTRVVTTYIDAIVIAEELRFYTALERDLGKLRDAARLRAKIGAGVDKVSLAMNESYFLQVVAARATAEANNRSVFARLSDLVGQEVSHVVLPEPLKDSLPVLDSEARAMAVQNHFGLSGAKSNRDAMNLYAYANGAALLPSIGLQFELSDLRSNDSLPVNDNVVKATRQRSASTNFVINVPILAKGGEQFARTRFAKRRAKASEYDLSAIRGSVITAANTVIKYVKASEDALSASEKAFEAAQLGEQMFVAEMRYGSKSPADAAQMTQRLLDANNQLSAARRNYWSNLMFFRNLLGLNTAKALNLPVKIHDPIDQYNKSKWKIFSTYTAD